MFHHISTSMPPTITMIIAWYSVCNIVILVLFVNYIKLPLASNWNRWKSRDGSQHLGVELQPYIHPFKKTQLTQLKAMSYKLQTIIEIKKLEMQYMDKPNGKHFQIVWNKDGLVVSSFPFPQGDESSIPIMAELNKLQMGWKGGARPKRPSLNMIFCKKISYLLQILDLKSNYVDMHN
jgi:hypothetical protein